MPPLSLFATTSFMYLFYLDESGNTGNDLDSKDQPVHWLVAIGLKPNVAQSIDNSIYALSLRWFGAHASDPTFELHGSHLFGGKGDHYSHLKPVHRIQIYQELMALVSTSDCHVFVRGISKALHKSRAASYGYAPDHPHTLGFMYLMEQLDEWLAARQPGALLGATEPLLGLVVADEHKETYRDVIRGFAHWRHYKTTGYRARTIQYLIDTVHYVQSQDSALIQLADCIAYLRGRVDRIWRSKGTATAAYTASEAVVSKLWLDYCAPRIASEKIWP